MTPEKNTGRGGKPSAAERASARRRHVRKGTRSCWECRRRKIRCLFDETSPSDTCRRCWGKGIPCVSQEFPEDHLPPAQTPAGSVGDRLGRMERLIEHLYQRTDSGKSPMPDMPQQLPLVDSVSSPKVTLPSTLQGDVAGDGGDDSGADNELRQSPLTESSRPADGQVSGPSLTPSAPQAKPQNSTTSWQTITQSHHRQASLSHGVPAVPRSSSNLHLSALANELAAALPSMEDCRIIRQLYTDADLMFQLMFTPHGQLEVQPQPVEEFLDSLYNHMHPVLMAKKMLTLATMIQRIPAAHVRGSPPAVFPRLLMQRMADAATSMVCENNKLMETIDALQCLVLQCIFLANGGNLRLALLACRRALSVGQLMGIHRPHDSACIATVDPASKTNTRFVWFRILYLERFICLLLGLPDSIRGSAGNFTETWRETLEEHPIDVLERMHCSMASKIIQRNEKDSLPVLLEITHSLDLEMQAAAASMPPRWWAVPKFNRQGNGALDIVEESMRLCTQMFHYLLLIEIHLPFMLRHTQDGAASSSRMACIDASREALIRFSAIRNAKGICSVPDAADFFALIAAMTLLLAHIDARRRDRGNDVLAHQRYTDRDKVEEALELMRDDSSVSTDMLSMRSADVLLQLLDIEARAAAGSTFTANLTPSTVSTPLADRDVSGVESGSLQLRIPYYGTVTISPTTNDGTWPAEDTNFHLLAPGFSACVQDWTFQGVDAAFFDSMIRGFEGPDSCYGQS
ncbi:uncharacterized protein CTRU02_211689 [Colletotrichum truncatum]|uniref:Uncharacterized protein n=1 Tax=Colletotrichum truncatum TaxID=5467 RepID=A0ACC3YLG0_COLTU|nr:uncharacterized protein CTRU02_15511 [Colletotrichum truncatum]KAF6780984.1 hypothetical protein CTRU02_15511 [Colletotrichum truncatum]